MAISQKPTEQPLSEGLKAEKLRVLERLKTAHQQMEEGHQKWLAKPPHPSRAKSPAKK